MKMKQNTKNNPKQANKQRKKKETQNINNFASKLFDATLWTEKLY